eukprot:SAG22_NODE_81_length_21778_cov_38.345173_4_plen_48_part_00
MQLQSTSPEITLWGPSMGLQPYRTVTLEDKVTIIYSKSQNQLKSQTG